MSLTLAQIAERVAGEVHGDPSRTVDHAAPLSSAGPSSVSFVVDKKYLSDLRSTQAGVVLLSERFQDACPVYSIVVKDPYLAYSKVASALYSLPRPPAGIHPSAVIGDRVQIGEEVSIGPHVTIGDGVVIGQRTNIGSNCYVGNDVSIGDEAYLHPNVTIYHQCELGDRVRIHSGAVIGSDGFGYALDGECWSKIPQVGRVVIGIGVEIGANTTIDRGALEDTVIGEGVIIDNLVQVAHNVHIGANTAIAACTGIAGSTHIGRNCTLAGGVGVVGHLQIADRVHITAMSLVTHSIRQAGAYSSGTPLESNSSWHRNAVRFKQLNQLAKRIKTIEKNVFNDNT